jgi:hypothetical protein
MKHDARFYLSARLIQSFNFSRSRTSFRCNMIRTPGLGLPRNSIPARSDPYRALICRAITASLTMLAGSALLSWLNKHDPRFAFRFLRSSECRSGPSVQRSRSSRCSTKNSPGSNRMREAANPTAPGESRKVSADEIIGSRKGVGRFTADPFRKKRDRRWSISLPIRWLTRSPGLLSRTVYLRGFLPRKRLH